MAEDANVRNSQTVLESLGQVTSVLTVTVTGTAREDVMNKLKSSIEKAIEELGLIGTVSGPNVG